MSRPHPLYGQMCCPEPWLIDDDELERSTSRGIEVGEYSDGSRLYVPLRLSDEIDRLVASAARACCGGVRHHTDECPEGPTPDELACMSHDEQPEPDADDLRADYEADLIDEWRGGWAS